MTKERTYHGVSSRGDFQAALNGALAALRHDLSSDGTRDPSATWVMREVVGWHRGLSGAEDIKVTLAATRDPEWP
jgi:hypothetical protein